MAKAKKQSKRGGRPKARAAGKSKSRATAKVSAKKKSASRKPKKKVSYIPQGMGAVVTNLCMKDAAKALEWYKGALGATVRNIMPGPGGKGVMHSEMKVGGTVIMVADEFPGWPNKSPETLGAATSSLYCYVPNCDKAFDRAVKAGAKVIAPLMTMFWGDRMGGFQDPFGHMWTMATHMEDVSPAQMKKRHDAFMADMMKQGGMGG